MQSSAPLESLPDLVSSRGSQGRDPWLSPVQETDATPLGLVCAAVAGSEPASPARPPPGTGKTGGDLGPLTRAADGGAGRSGLT